MNNLPKYVTNAIAKHDFAARSTFRLINLKTRLPRTFVARPTEIYMNGPDCFGERWLIVEEIDDWNCTTVATWKAVVGNGKCYQF